MMGWRGTPSKNDSLDWKTSDYNVVNMKKQKFQNRETRYAGVAGDHAWGALHSSTCEHRDRYEPPWYIPADVDV